MAKCALLPCDNYDYEQVRTALQKAVTALGGFGPYIAPGERVLLKANLLMRKKPEDATTTHPVFVQALASLLIEHGASVVIGDSPGGPFTPVLMHAIYRSTGMVAAAAASGATLNTNFKSCERENPRGVLAKRLTVTDMVNDVDKIITVAKLKTHAMMTYTGAVKNLFGLVPGIVKAEYHLNMSDYDYFADMLVDVCQWAAPAMSFIDGIVGMEGHGPSSGTPARINVVMAGDSPYHLDQAACHIIGLPTEEVPTLRRQKARGLIGALDDIDFVCEHPNAFLMPDYEIVRGKTPLNLRESNLPESLKRLMGRHLQSRPVIDHAVCNGCGICREACPAHIIDIKHCTQCDGRRRAFLKLSDCIRCYCCQELCPQKAIKVFKPRLARWLSL